MAGDPKQASTNLASTAAEAALAWLQRYNDELDAQALSPNGDDFNRVCDGVGVILAGGAPPDIRLSPANR